MKPSSSPRRTPRKSVTSKQQKLPVHRKVLAWLWSHIRALLRMIRRPVRQLRDLRRRRTHKSFMMSRRRDYLRPLNLPGLLRMTLEAARLLGSHKKLFLSLSLIFALLALLLGGLSSQQIYNTASDVITGENSNEVSSISQALTLVASSANLLSAGLTEAQQIYIGIIVLMTWLVTVWLLREILAGNKPRLRDGLYSAGSPIVATVIVCLMLLIQLVPAGIMAIIYTALSSSGLISEGLGAFLFFGVAALVATLTLYWITSTFIALVIVTLPGMYPWRAMRAASDIIVGRRLQIFYRVIWLLLSVVVLWAAVMLPVVLLDNWLRGQFAWYGVVPVVTTVSVWLSSAVTIWAATYIYLLYRKVVESDARSGD